MQCRTLSEDAWPDSVTANSEPLPSFEAPQALLDVIWKSPSDPQTGDIWRVRWNNDSELVVVLEVKNRWVTSAPLVVDPLDEDPRCVRMSADESAMGLEAVVWMGLTDELPMGVFEARFGAVSNETVRRINDAEKRADVTTAPRTVELRIRLVGAMSRLNRARWHREIVTKERPDVRAMALSKNVATSSIADALAITPAEVTDIFRARRILDPTEIDALAGLLEVPARDLEPLGGLPDSLMCSIERPRYRSAIVRRARAARTSETAIRVDVATHVLPMAARSRGSKTAEPVWDDLIDDYLRVDA